MAVPQHRAEHDRVLEPLGAVDRHHLHQVAVGLEPQLQFFVGRRIAALRLQPAQQRLEQQPRLDRLGNEVVHSRLQAAVAVLLAPREHARRHARFVHPRAQRPRDAAGVGLGDRRSTFGHRVAREHRDPRR